MAGFADSPSGGTARGGMTRGGLAEGDMAGGAGRRRDGARGGRPEPR